MRPLALPNGDIHDAAPHGIHFSVTDAQGVITQLDDGFAQLCRVDAAQLVGQPHRIIRHPEMPAGTFRLVWEMLHGAVPTCAYLKNLASDGSSFWTFTTIVPVGEQFLGIHIRPTQRHHGSEIQASLQQTYRAIRAQELRLRGKGMDASAFAGQGADQLENALIETGHESYVGFILSALPAEVAGRPGGEPSPLRQRLQRTVLNPADDSSPASGGPVRVLRDLLADNAPRVTTAARQSPAVAGSLQGVVAAADAVLAVYANAAELADQDIARQRETGFRRALLILQTELVERHPQLADLLAEPLAQELRHLADDLAWTEIVRARAGSAPAESAGPLRQLISLCSNWRLMAVRQGLSTELGDLLTAVDKALGEVKQLGTQGAAPARPGFDVAAAVTELAALRSTVSARG